MVPEDLGEVRSYFRVLSKIDEARRTMVRSVYSEELFISSVRDDHKKILLYGTKVGKQRQDGLIKRQLNGDFREGDL